MSQTDRSKVGRQRGDAYRFLASLFARPLTAEAIRHLAPLAADAGESGFSGEIVAAFGNVTNPDELAQRLALEHTRLFRGISEEYGPPPPYESLWREGQLMGETTVRVASRYLEAGYAPDGALAPCDHLAEELRFMAALCLAEDDAETSADVEQLRQQQMRFLDEHLGAWVGDYCQRIAETAHEPLYGALARITATVVAGDALYLRQAPGGMYDDA